MSLNKKILLLCLLQFQSVFAAKEVDLIFKSSVDFNSYYISKDENKEKGEKFKPFTYDRSGYNLTLADVDVKFKKYDLNLGAVIKSQRKDLRLNDFDNEKDKKKARNHDIMGKVYVNYITPEFHGLKLINNFTYYIDDINAKRVKDEENETIKDVGSVGEYIETDGKKQALGNVLLSTQLKGKVKETLIDTKVEYKANQLTRFDKDESYLKLSSNVKSNLTKNLVLDASYNFDWDLNFSSKKFDTFNNKLEEYPDAGLPGHYIDKLNHEAKLNLSYDKDRNHINFNNTIKVDQLLSHGVKKRTPIQKIYNVIKPTSSLEYRFDILKNLSVGPKFISQFLIKTETNYAQSADLNNIYEKLYAYLPKLELGVTYDNKKVKNELSLGYGAKINVREYLSKESNIPYEPYLNNKLKIDLPINSKLKLNLENDINLSLKIKDRKVYPSSDKIGLNLNLEYKPFENLEILTNISDKFTLTSKKLVLNPDDYQNNFDASVLVKYEAIKDKLNFEAKGYYKNQASFVYFPVEKDMQSLNKKLVYLGNIRPTHVINTVGLNTKVEYKTKINDKISILTGLNVDANIKTLSLTKERLYHYHNTKKDIPSNKENPKTSDYRHKINNVGGKLEFTPFVQATFTPLEKLDLLVRLDADILFEKEVVNLIKDDNRPDNGSFSYIDKNFVFKKLNPRIKFEMKYKW